MTRNPTEINFLVYSPVTFLKKECIREFFEFVWFVAFNTESESENIINVSMLSQILIKSKTRPSALICFSSVN